MRHNEIWDTTATLLTEVCSNVCVEPHLQPFSSEYLNGASAQGDDGVRLDISVDGFWGASREKAIFEFRVFNPFAMSNRHQSLPSVYRAQENEKKRQYNEKVREVEQASFMPLVLLATEDGPERHLYSTIVWHLCCQRNGTNHIILL